MGTNASGKKITWKVLAIFLAVLMLITALPMSAFAAPVFPITNIKEIFVNVPDEGDDGSKPVYTYYEGDEFKFSDISSGITVDIDCYTGADIKGVTPDEFWSYGLYVTPNDGTTLGLGDNGLAIRVCYGNEANFTLRCADIGTIRVEVKDQWNAVLVEGRNNIKENGTYVIVVDGNGDGKPDTALSDVASAKSIAFNNNNVITYSKPLTGKPVEFDGFVIKTVDESIMWKIWNATSPNGLMIEDVESIDSNGNPVTDKNMHLNMGNISAFGFANLPVGLDTDYLSNGSEWVITDTSNAFITAYNKVPSPFNYNLVYNAEGNYFSANIDFKANNTGNEWGNFWIYEVVRAYVKDIEVKKDPTKMTYFEGETLNVEGMVVTLKYSNGYTRDITADQFKLFGIEVSPAGMLTVDDDNNDPVIVRLSADNLFVNTNDQDLEDVGNGRLVVKAKAVMAFELADFVDGKLPDGQYVIVATTSNGSYTAPKTGVALNNNTSKAFANIDVLGANNVTIANKMVNPDKITADNIFQVTKNANGYTIQDSDGKYVARTTASNGFLTNRGYNNLVLKDSIDDAPLAGIWQITGTFEEDVWGNDASSKRSGSYWLASDGSVFGAVSNDNLGSKFAKLTFYKVLVKGYVKLEVIAQPTVEYTEGDKLDLYGLTVALYDDNGNKTVVTYEDFAAYGITTSIAQDTVLAAADNGKAITVALGEAKADTAALKIYGPDLNTYTLADEIADGKYIIVYKESSGVVNGLETVYNYHALSTIPTTNRQWAGTPFSDEAGWTRERTLSGKLVDVKDEKITSKVTTDMIWTVKAVKDRDGKIVSYDITDVNGNYLERANALENGLRLCPVVTVPAADKSETAYLNAWQITGAEDARIYVEIDKDNAITSDTYDIVYRNNSTNGQDAEPYFMAVYDSPFANYSFYKVNGVVTEFALANAPKLAYINGEKLDLSGAKFTLVTSDGTNATVDYADAAKYGITVSLANEKALSLSDNGTVITATCGGKTVTVGTLAVSAVEFDRLAGATRIQTAIEIAKAGWDKADYVVLASALNYADALAAAPLATAYDAPILLTKGDALEADVLAQIKALAAKQVIIVGGEKAVSANVAAALTANGINSTVIAGADRTETSTKIAAALFTKTGATADEFFFVRSDEFADALSVSAVAGIKKSPIIYINKAGNLDASVANYLKSIATSELKSTIIVGGTSAIGETAETALKGYFKDVKRIGGADRYATSLLVVKTYDSIFTSKDVAVATGKNYPDALAGGAFAAKNNMPVLLVADGEGTVGVRDYIKNKADFGKLYCFGGELALSNDTVATLLN